ncbi:type II secretion system GspH family protein [Patescibacteria group bacterium]|nr:type II secretion system GspH family protein [Patescibacteria group bacterium]
MLNRPQQQNTGFTLIEMLVALSLFTIVVTIAVGAFLSLIGASKSVQGEQSVITTLTFVLDSMTREIRTGTNYYCNTRSVLDDPTQVSTSTVRDCAGGSDGLSFIEAGTSVTSGASNRRIAYYFDTSSATNTIMRKVGNGTPQSIVSDGITVTNAEFFVTGSDRLGTGTDINQPTVTIVLEARDENGATTTLQTTVTQRELDI